MFTDNGPATSARLALGNRLDGQLDEYYSGVAVDSAGNLYIADTHHYRIREVSDGVITTVAGNGIRGFSGDYGPATSAQLNFPTAVAVDSNDNLYIADSNRIRKCRRWRRRWGSRAAPSAAR